MGCYSPLPTHHHHHHHSEHSTSPLVTQAPEAPARPIHMQHRDTLLTGRPSLTQQEDTHY
ncbi:hypothetical protein E2C01_000524 [Portunus trituberculatus]|uniref:Uncharacterized protein n=1 Tax=Portunus trituberculatus TaxID=210409 RepID=A0A5B7CFB5_PORTR|nr:hypothetical protein [Portunus trituberculatus]